ncbi:hypothetical protein O0L34_g15880 [Tuta absoluta]|nr:hypothetical protein O0L34_g15880 [Tuta absoluta]
MEEVVQDQTIDVKPRVSRRKYVRNGCILLFAVALGYLHYRYVSTLHENYYHFSHLSDLERELTLRTEMGFYYSYYKTVVEERPFLSAMTRLMYDRLVEYPEEVNAFNRFNIHPEVIIGALYRYAEPVLNTSNHKECHLVHRGEGLPPVQSCGGLGVPMMFYLEAVWILAGLLVTVVFLQGATLSGTVLGGVLSAAQYLANHGQATRVQRSPNERENLAVPLLCLQVNMHNVHRTWRCHCCACR